MANPITYLFGYARFQVSIADSAALLNICARLGAVYRNQKSDEASLRFECSYSTARRLENECKKYGITPISIEYKGLPHLIYRYRKRLGIPIGILVGVTLTILSSTVVWDIRIDGENRLTEEQVLRELETCGMRVGSRLRTLDTDVIQNRIIIYSDDISWISINLIGTVAHVEIRETLPVPEDEEKYEAANLVSNRIGIIERLEDVRGEVCVKVGDLVGKDELLVSGIRESKTQGFSYTCAEGKVFARCESVYEVQIPLNYKQKYYTGEEYKEKYIIFFNNQLKIYTNKSKMSSKYDIIEYEEEDTVKMLSLSDTVGLPFGVRSVVCKEFEYRDATYSAEEATELAIEALKAKEAELGIEGIISKDLEGEFTEDAYILRCKATSVQNIARQVEVEIIGKD